MNANDIAGSIRTILGHVKTWAALIAAVCIILMLAAKVLAAAFGIAVPYVRTLGYTELAYAAGVLWLTK